MAALAVLLGACAVTDPGVGERPAADRTSQAGEIEDQSGDAGWQPFVLPGKRATQYRFTTKQGRWAIEAVADTSASMLRRPLDVPPESLADIRWAWWVDEPLPDADLGHVERTDAPARVVLAFDGDKSRLPLRERLMFELAHALTGEEPPYATLVYAWATHRPVESVVHNPRSDRVRKIVVDSGTEATRRWREHRRDIAADYHRVFGEAPGRLIGVAVMTDADNTRSRTRAWYGRITFVPRTRDPQGDVVPVCRPGQGSNCSSPNS